MTEWSDSSAQLCMLPAATATASAIPRTVTCEALLLVPPSPSCPSVPRPQHFTVPPVITAQEWLLPAETATALEMPETATGAPALAVVP